MADPSPPDPDDDATRREESGAAPPGGDVDAGDADAGEASADDWEWETGTTAASSDPLGDLARDVRDRNRSSSEVDELFESVDVEEIDSETVWSSIEESDQEAGPGVAPAPVAEADVAAAPVVDVDADDASAPEQVVPRADYCTRCEYLADPPTLACTHDGTDIVEVVDHEHFLVRACPFVEEQSVGPVDDPR